jgi:rod shape-determining protein MreC
MGGFLPPAERRSSALVGLYAALSLLLLITGDRLPQSALRGIGAWIFSPFDRVVLVVDRASAAWRENQRLHQRVAELEFENVRLRDEGVENQRLRQQLGLPPRHGVTLKPVEVLALSGELVPSTATLGAGRDQGVHEGDVVVTHEGLVGRIGESYALLSRVILLTDANAPIACEVESVGVMGILHYVTTPYPRLVLAGVPLADSVRIGQRVLTSGLSRRYPRSLPVGRIVRLGVDVSGLSQDIEIEPEAHLSHLRHAFVIPAPDSLRERR